jgi:RHS repeat-associated protein
MHKLNGSIRMLTLLLLAFAGGSALADTPALPPGMGRYVMVLWPAGAPIPGDPKGTVKDVPEPDVTKFGGKLLFKHDNRRVIQLPLAAAKELRKHEAVVYLQRIWMGESFAGWDETYTPSSAPAGRLRTEADTNLHWGPKSYSYDGSGNIKEIDDAATGNDHYNYDSAGRLIYAQVSGPAISQKSETYAYDSFGNLIERDPSGANPVSIAIDGESNRMLGSTYDAAGNVTSADAAEKVFDQYSPGGRRVYTWDSLNMLTRVHPSVGSDRRIIYDPSDERIGTMLVGDSLTRWTIRDFDAHIIREFEAYHYGLGDYNWYWYWDEDNFYGEGTLLAGETQAWQFVSGEQFGGPRHYHLDHLGSVRMVTNGSSPGRALSENDYFPFGTTATRTYQEQTDWANNHIDSMRFAGHWRDFLGLLNVDNTEYIDYMHARHYDPNLGRFLSVDPGRGDPHRPQSWNRYSYVENNPVGHTDPTGQCTDSIVCLNYNHVEDEVTVTTPPPQQEGTWAAAVEDMAIGTAQFNTQAAAEWAKYQSGAYDAIAPDNNEMLIALPIAGAMMPGAAAATSAGSRVFWSGSEVAGEAAASFARANGATTLEMTATGQALTRATATAGWEATQGAWAAASRSFAEGAAGDITVFHAATGVRVGGMWATEEFPTLVANPAVTGIRYMVVYPNGAVIPVP